MSTGMSALLASGLTKRFGRKLALDDVDLSVPDGSITALIGPNGAGKTTLMRVFLAFERPDLGYVSIDGVDPWKSRRQALESVAYVPQTPPVARGLSVEDHLLMARSLRRGFDLAYARRRLDELSIPLGQKAETLSGGQAAQLALALALGTRARVLLLDEPLGSLDPFARHEFIRVLREAVRTQGASGLLSSHIITDVEDACDRVAILANGKVRLDSSIQEARSNHRLTEANADHPGGRAVGTFLSGPHGQTAVTLWRTQEPSGSASDRDSDRAGLDEVVLGYLSAARDAADSEYRESRGA